MLAWSGHIVLHAAMQSDIVLIDSLFVKAIRSADIADSVDTKKAMRAMSACAVFIESIDNSLLVIAWTALSTATTLLLRMLSHSLNPAN